MNLLYLTFGKRVNYHFEAVFSIYSFLAKTNSIEKVFVYTDAPEFYSRLGELVTVCTVDKQQLEEWKGKYGFFWRVKIKTLEDAALKNPDKHLIYLDSDTFIYQRPVDFEKALNQNCAFMHKQETLLSDSPLHTETRMWRQIKERTFEGITINKNHAMWNAGFIAIPTEKQLQTIDLTLRLCDAMCAANVTPRLIEQFAFSLALQETYPLMPADDFAGHYWGNKNEWDELINTYFVESYLQKRTKEEEIEKLNFFDFNQIPIIRKPQLIYKRLNNYAKKHFPDREIFLRK